MSSRFYDNNPIHQRAFLREDGTSPLINVNGSVTPIPFTWTPPAGTVFKLDEVDIVFTGPGNINNVSNFMNMSTLTNGLMFETHIDGVVNEVVNLKTNFDLINQLNTTFELKLLGTTNVLVGNIKLKRPLVFDGDNSDLMCAVVRDDFSGLDYSAISVVGVIEIK